MQKKFRYFIFIAGAFHLTEPAVTPQAKAATPATPVSAKTTPKASSTISIPLAYDVRIMNTSPVPATLTSVTVAYGINGQTFATKKPIPANQNTIPANQTETLLNHQNMLSFGASITITSSDANATATFQGITAIEVDGQELNLTTTVSRQFGSSIIYIANTASPGQTPSWKLTTAPVAPPAPKQPVQPKPIAKTLTPTVGTNNAVQATAVPIVQRAPTIPATPTTPMPIHPKKPTSLASKSSTKALNTIPTPIKPA